MFAPLLPHTLPVQSSANMVQYLIQGNAGRRIHRCVQSYIVLSPVLDHSNWTRYSK
jgi:hypothetical protein